MATKPPPRKPAPANQPPAGQARNAPQARTAPPQRPAAKPQPAQQQQESPPEELSSGGGRFIFFMAVPSWFVSMVVHAVMLLVMAMFSFSSEIEEVVNQLVVDNTKEEQEELEEFEIEEIEMIDVQVFENTVSSESITQPQAVESLIQPDKMMSNDIDVAPAAVELSEFGEQTAPKNDLLTEIGHVTGKGVEGRGSAEARGEMVRKYGGTEGSEKAVAAALKWLADHQMPDGGWSFEHGSAIGCRGQCDHHGTAHSARNGATAMALLPFLGAGQTHIEGKYKQAVYGGLNFLGQSQKSSGSFHEGGGSMYSHGLCAIALCEAYAMTKDQRLIGPAQMSLNFIVDAQDPVGGGWRYSPRQAGDTSAVGWQVMALKSGHMGYLQVPKNVILGTNKFLDTVQQDSGAYYGYAGPGKGAATTAVGLLCRMYLGWDQQEPGLQRGAEWLSGKGPSLGKNANMYYNYYATQVMRHYYSQASSEEWKEWNTKMRDFLVESQEKSGHATGSWAFHGGHANDRGGRLYCTSMATMVLEVYYRHMPIYSKSAAKDDFEL